MWTIYSEGSTIEQLIEGGLVLDHPTKREAIEHLLMHFDPYEHKVKRLGVGCSCYGVDFGGYNFYVEKI